jgi:signal transduction histidine kinase
MSGGSRGAVASGGLVVAGVGFLLTRSATAASTAGGTSAPFLVGKLPFLVVGLGLSLFGVVLAVSRWGRTHGWTVARWCLLGTAATGVAIGASLLGTELAGTQTSTATRALGFDLLLTGAVGGALTGVQAWHAQERDLTERTARLTLLNRILRHEALNGVNVVRGYAGLVGEGSDDGQSPDAARVIERSADRIGDAVGEVTALSRPDRTSPVAVQSVVDARVAAAVERHPDAEFTVEGDATGVDVCATDRVADLFDHLLRNAVEHNPAGTPRVTVRVEATWRTVRVTVDDDGPGLPAPQRRILLDGSLPEYDDPSAGFGLTVVRLLAEESEAAVGLDDGVGDAGTAVSVTFRRHRTPDGRSPAVAGGVPKRRIRDAGVAAAVAGVAMGLLLETVQGSIPVIGSLYGVSTPLVGWTTHQFHSLVFGVGFAALLGTPRLARYRDRLGAVVLVGAGYGAALSFVAAGVVMPLWFRTLGVPAPLPNLSAVGLVGHLVWGVTLGAVFAALQR